MKKGEFIMIGKEFKTGVYMKQNGKLVLVENEIKDGEKTQFVFDGRVADNPLIRFMIPKKADRPLVGWNGKTLGWGPTSYLNYCEYLGEL